MAGIFHAYYTVALAPAVAALVGIGAVLLWQRRESYAAAIVMSCTVAFTSAFGFVLLDRTSDYLPWLKWVVAIVGLVVRAAAGRRAAPAPHGRARRRCRRARRRTRRPRGVLRHDRGHPAHRLDPDRRPEQRRRLRRAAAARRLGGGTPPTGTQGQAPTQGGTGRRRRHRRLAAGGLLAGQPVERRDHRAAADRRVVVHLGGRGRRLQLRGRLPARQRAAGDGDRRLQRQRPEPDARAVPAVRRRRARSTTSSPAATAAAGAGCRRRQHQLARSPPGWRRASPRQTVDGVTLYDLSSGVQ